MLTIPTDSSPSSPNLQDRQQQPLDGVYHAEPRRRSDDPAPNLRHNAGLSPWIFESKLRSIAVGGKDNCRLTPQNLTAPANVNGGEGLPRKVQMHFLI